LYIGTAKSILNLWGTNFNKKFDDQRFVIKKCQQNPDMIYIDSNYLLFYNYSKKDKITIKNKKIYINDNEYSTPIISFPGISNPRKLIENLGFNIDTLKEEKKSSIYYYLKTYIQYYIFELLILIIIIFLIHFLLKSYKYKSKFFRRFFVNG